jgi:TolB-like protein
MTNFLAELRRRNVFRVAAAYLVVSWLLIQISALLEASLGLPVWFDAVVIGFLAVCFPIAVLLAWAFEMTPEGMKLTAAVPDGQSIAPTTGRKLDFAIVAALALMIAFIAWQQLAPRGAAPANPIAVAPVEESASVAVLPFVDLSQAGDQEYFSDGISEEILNVLVRIPGLGVAGRTSSFAFKGRNEDLRTIGEALGVNHVLEGSVRRSGTRLRITAQLIRSSDGFHIWSETYDREIADIFDIQDEIAAAVANELAVSMGLDWQSGAHSRTDDIEAYEKYLRAHQLYLLRGEENMETAALLLHEVVARDPDFAPAWTALAGVYGAYGAYSLDQNPDHIAQWQNISGTAARRAIALDPESGEAWIHLAVHQSASGNWIWAFDSIDRALALAPNNSTVLDQATQMYLQTGYIVQARELEAQAIVIDPLVALYHSNVGWATAVEPAANLAGAIASFHRGIALDPSLGIVYLNLFNALEASGERELVLAAYEQAVADNAFSDVRIHDYGALFRAWAEGPDAVRAVAPLLDPEIAIDAGIILGDADLFVDQLIAIRNKPGANVASYLYLAFPGELRANPRWRQFARELGLLDLWQVRGFPDGCRAFGEDDFQCGGEPDQ